ncbi:MAG: 4'-phosphopantetheinyl transferase family protein [Flavobacteriales bacterium]
MPLIYNHKLNDSQTLAIWKWDEDLLPSLESLNPNSKQLIEFQSIKHEKRQKEWLAARLLLKDVGFDHPISYLPNGKPVTLDGPFFSLSHCLPYIGMTSNDTSVGLDIQKPEEKMLRIKSKFAHPEELEHAAKSADELNYVSILWSAKEAIFKVYGENILFAEELRIEPFHIEDELIHSHYIAKGKKTYHPLHKLYIDGHWVLTTV